MQEHSFWLPPEVWSECHRWATLPSTGRLPTDLPATCLDLWPKGTPTYFDQFDGPDACYQWEQSCLYPTKSSLMLVCREWYHIAAVWMYESLVVRLLDGNNVDKLIETFETPRGAELAKLVKRIDIDKDREWCSTTGIDYDSLLLLHFLNQHCANAKIFAMWYYKIELGSTICIPFSTMCMREVNVFLVSRVKSDAATIAAAETWRCLRIIEDSSGDLPPPFPAVTFSRGFERLERLTVIFLETLSNSSPLLASFQCHSLVSLTHLTIIIQVSWEAYHVPSVCDFLRQFGK
jgi:hypothetical protein